MILFALPPHERMGRTIARELRARFGQIEHRVFSDGERYVRPVTRVHGQDVCVVANTGPASDAFLDCGILLHALHTNGARSITLAILYFAYARQDRSTKPQEPATAALVARLLEAAGVTRAVLVDPHSEATVSAFRVPVQIVDPLPELATRVRNSACDTPVVVAPDAGARPRAQRLARLLGGRDVVVLKKARPRPNAARVAALTPQDRRRVIGRPVVLVDDMIDTAGTITAAAQRLRAAGCSRIVILATHAILSGPAIRRLRKSRVDHIIVTDSLALPPGTRTLPLRVASLTAALTKVLHTP